jgi:hypothetical protein
MSLTNWAENGWLTPHRTTPREIQDLLTVIDRDIRAAEMPDQDTDWKLSMAHNACLQCATAALAVEGFRVSRENAHYRTLQSLAFTLNPGREVIDLLDTFRRMRNFADYERAGEVSAQDAQDSLQLARALRARLLAYLKLNHPNLLPASNTT